MNIVQTAIANGSFETLVAATHTGTAGAYRPRAVPVPDIAVASLTVVLPLHRWRLSCRCAVWSAAKLEYFTYMGSLSTPPCTMGVIWVVLAKPAVVGGEQAKPRAVHTHGQHTHARTHARSTHTLAHTHTHTHTHTHIRTYPHAHPETHTRAHTLTLWDTHSDTCRLCSIPQLWQGRPNCERRATT